MKKQNIYFIIHKPVRSQRRYTKRNCKNPGCQHEPEFAPHDARQEFCCVQCRTNYFNDLRKMLNETQFSDLKYLKQYEKILTTMYVKTVDDKGYCCVHIRFFKWEGFDLTMLTKERVNTDTGGKIRWFFNFGVERHPTDSNFLIIHKKSNT
jgi:hypothetical protein